tara:strand:+ start:586 stop:1755 length:1170 start_codon:yes stop_codon:yes gene_type:complete
MSEIKVNSIKGVGASAAAITVNNSDGTCAANITSVNGGQFSNRNVIINGACRVAQRSNLTNAQTGYGAVDRFKIQSSGASRFTLSQHNGPGAQYGLPLALKFETTTADDSVAAGDYMYIDTKFEGQDLQRFQKGSSDAKQFTLQFWIKLAVQGTYVVQLFDADNSRHVVANYTVSSPNTWEKKIITFPADTSGVLDSDNQKSFEVRWHFLGGSTYRGGTQQTTWGSIVAANMLEGMGNAVSATGDNFITGMQLEVGSVATDFEHRSFADELLRCQRYYQVSVSEAKPAVFAGRGTGTSNVYMTVPLTCSLRDTPSLSDSNFSSVYAYLYNSRPSNGSSGTVVTDPNQFNPTGAYISVTVGGFGGNIADDRVVNIGGYATDNKLILNSEL